MFVNAVLNLHFMKKNISVYMYNINLHFKFNFALINACILNYFDHGACSKCVDQTHVLQANRKPRDDCKTMTA